MRFRVSGDRARDRAGRQLFQPLNPLLGPAPAQPPANIAILPLVDVRREGRACAAVDQFREPGASAVPGAQTGTQWQVQAQVDPAALRGSPAHALAAGDATPQSRRALASRPGRLRRQPRRQPQHALPATRSTRRRSTSCSRCPARSSRSGSPISRRSAPPSATAANLALLRARGARRRDLVLARAARELAARARSPAGSAPRSRSAPCIWPARRAESAARACSRRFGVCVVLAVAGAAAARIGAGLAAFRGSVGEARAKRPPARDGRSGSGSTSICSPSPSRGLVYWLTVRTGFSAVVNPDSNPTLSLSVYMFLAPALLWLGAALLLVRLRGRAGRLARRRAAGGRATTSAGFLLASAGRRGAAINRGLLVARAPARLRRQPRHLRRHLRPAGAHRRAAHARRRRRRDARRPASSRAHGSRSESRGCPAPPASRPSTTPTRTSAPTCRTPSASTRRRSTRGRRCATRTSSAAAPRRCSTGCARPRTASSSRRRRSPTTRFSLGDLLRLRVLDHASGRFRVAPFHVVGVVQEFPSAPKDSFMVANLDYLERVTHDPGPNVVFVRGERRPVAPRTRASRSATRTLRRQRQGHPPADGADGQLDHDRRPARDQPDRGGVRARPRRGRDGALRRRRPRRAAAGARDDGRARRLAARGRRVPLERGRARARGGARARRAARLAAGRDARRDAPARLRSAARPPRRPVGVPRPGSPQPPIGGCLRRRCCWPRCRSGRLPLGAILREE